MRTRPPFLSFARSFVLLSASALLLPALGCGPEFFSAKGTISSSGGALGNWSSTPAMCTRDEFDGDSSKLVTFIFAAPPNNDPDRDLHRDKAPNGASDLHIARNGDSYIAQLSTMKPINTGNEADTFKNMQGIVLDSSKCKTLTFTRTEQMATMGGFHKPLKGELVMDCTAYGSHIVADINFKHCGM